MSEYMRWKKSGKRRMECAEYQYILDDEKKSPKIGSTKCYESKKVFEKYPPLKWWWIISCICTTSQCLRTPSPQKQHLKHKNVRNGDTNHQNVNDLNFPHFFGFCLSVNL